MEHSSEDSSEENVFQRKPNHTYSKKGYEGIIPKSVSQSLNCRFCKAAFSHRSNRRRHERSCTSSPSSSNQAVVKVCNICNVGFSTQRNYTDHKKTCNLNPSSYSECVEPGCTIKFHTRSQMVNHLEKDHLHEVKCKELTFEDEASFQKWKGNENMNQFMSTVKHTGDLKTNEVSYVYYVCNFDVQNRKAQVRHKIPGCKCPARLLIKIVGKKHFVKYIKSHTHSLEPYNFQFHQLNDQTLDYVKACLSKGMSPWSIWRELVPPNDGTKNRSEKNHFITLRQIKKIHANLIRSTRLDNNDAEAVKLLAMQMHKDQDSVLVYKPQGQPTLIGDNSLDNIEHSDTLFAFGFQNQRMRDELKLAESKILCIDATHNTNKYKFYLLNLIVPDEYGVGYPVGHFITNTLDTETQTSLFQNIKNKCPNLEMVALMTDDDNCTWNAFKKVFGDKARHLLCKWHVHRTWQRQLVAHIKEVGLRNNVYRDLVVLLEERNSVHFHTMLETFTSKYSKLPGSQSFITEYFQPFYCDRVSEWAMSYRNFPHGETDTNMFCESFHSVFKRYYLNRKVNCRIDDLIKHLVDYEYYKYLELDRKRVFRIPHKSLENSDLINRHDRGVKIKDADVVKDKDIPNHWVVKSVSRQNSVEHTVTKVSEKCFLPELCFLKCPKRTCQNLCSHLYYCSCEDRHVLCKHIHKVHTLEVQELGIDLQFIQEVNESNDPVEFCMYSSPSEENPPSEVSEQNNLKKLCFSLNEKISYYLEDKKVQSSLLPHIHGKLSELLSVCKSVSEGCATFPSSLPSMDHPPIPPNQKETKQKSFFQTIKRRKVASKVLQYPSHEAQFSLKKTLLNFEFPEGIVDFEDHIASSWAELTRPLFSLGNDEYLVSLIDLKSIDDRLPEAEHRRLELLSGGQFQFAWLSDSIIDAFLFTLCRERLSVLHVKNIIVQQVLKEDVDLDINDFWHLNFTGRTHIYIPYNSGNHWVSILVHLETKTITFLDPNRPPDSSADSLLQIFSFGQRLRNPIHHSFVQQMKLVLGHILKKDMQSWCVEVPLKQSVQKDGVNCGVFICWYLDRFLKNEPYHMTADLDTHSYRRQMIEAMINVVNDESTNIDP